MDLTKINSHFLVLQQQQQLHQSNNTQPSFLCAQTNYDYMTDIHPMRMHVNRIFFLVQPNHFLWFLSTLLFLFDDGCFFFVYHFLSKETVIMFDPFFKARKFFVEQFWNQTV